MSRWRVVLLVLVVVVSACTDSTGEVTTTAPVTSSVAPTTSLQPTTLPPTTTAPPTTLPPTSTTADPDRDDLPEFVDAEPGKFWNIRSSEVPELDLTAPSGTPDEFRHIVDQHLEFQRWLGLHVVTDAAVMTLSMDPEGPLSALWLEQAERQARDGWILSATRFEIESFSPVADEDANDNLRVMFVGMSSEMGTTAWDAATAEVILQREPLELTFFNITLAQAPDGRWLLWETAIA